MIDQNQIEATRTLMTRVERLGLDRRSFLRLLATTGGGSAVAALVAACGPGSPSAPTAAPAAAPNPTAPAAAAAAPTALPMVPVGVATVGAAPTTAAAAAAPATTTSLLVAASGQDIANLDPHTGHDYSIASAQKAVYDSLLTYRENPPKLQNLLAVSYEANADASEWTFHLDPRAVFHDGTPVKASDVAYSVGRLLRKNKGAAWMFVNIMDPSSAQAVDDHTVTFKLKTPFAPLPLVLPWLFIAEEQLLKQHDVGGDEGEKWLLDHEAGSGPFTIKSWQVGDSYTFEAIKDYWAGWPAQGHLSGFVWKIIRESTSQRLALLKGDAHIAFELGAEDIQALSKEAAIVVDNLPSISVFAVKLNNQKGPTSDLNVRQAISYAMDYEAIVKALNGRAVLLQGPLPSNLGDYAHPGLKPYRYDMAKAEEALKQSKQYGSGGFELEYVYVTGLQIEEQIGLILLDKLSQFDITVKMQPLVWPDMVARAKSADTAPAMMAVYSGTDYADPDNFLWQAYHSSQAGFWAAASHYKNPEFDKLLEDARSNPDHQKRVELYRSAQEILVNDAVEVWGHSEFPKVALSKKLAGYDSSPIMGYYLRPLFLQG